MLLLKQIRKSKGISVIKLSQLCGISRRTIEDAESRGDCRLSTAYKLATALQIPLDALWQPDKEQD